MEATCNARHDRRIECYARSSLRTGGASLAGSAAARSAARRCSSGQRPALSRPSHRRRRHAHACSLAGAAPADAAAARTSLVDQIAGWASFAPEAESALAEASFDGGAARRRWWCWPAVGRPMCPSRAHARHERWEIRFAAGHVGRGLCPPARLLQDRAGRDRRPGAGDLSHQPLQPQAHHPYRRCSRRSPAVFDLAARGDAARWTSRLPPARA